MHDIVPPFKRVVHLENTLKKNGVDYQLFVGKHSGHGLQNDESYMETVKEYFAKYMPVGK